MDGLDALSGRSAAPHREEWSPLHKLRMIRPPSVDGPCSCKKHPRSSLPTSRIKVCYVIGPKKHQHTFLATPLGHGCLGLLKISFPWPVLRITPRSPLATSSRRPKGNYWLMTNIGLRTHEARRGTNAATTCRTT